MAVGGGAATVLGDHGAPAGVIELVGVVADQGASAAACIDVRQLIDGRLPSGKNTYYGYNGISFPHIQSKQSPPLFHS